MGHVTTQMRSRPVRDTPVRTPPRSLDDMDGGGADRSRDGLRMVSRVSVGGLGMGCEWLAGLVSRVCIYVDWRGWEIWSWVVNG